MLAQKRKGDTFQLNQAIRLVQSFATTTTYDEVRLGVPPVLVG